MRRCCLSAMAAMGCALLLAPARAGAVINADNPGSATPDNESAPPDLPEWNNVGQVNGGSGVYIGNGWVLTADHVSAGNFTLDGTVYDFNGQGNIRLSNPDNSGADVVMFQLSTIPVGVPNLTIANTSAPDGTAFYNVGYGVARNTAEEYFDYDGTTFTQTGDTSAPYQGFGFGSEAKSWGENVIAGTASFNIGYGPVNAFYSEFEDASNSDQLIFGDSGGGAFNDDGVLIGMNDAIGFVDGQTTSNPNNTVLFGDQSYMVDIAPFYDQIEAIVVPEPSCVALLAVGGIALAARRRKRQPA